MIDRPARQALISRLRWVLDGDSTVQAAIDAPSQTEDETVLEVEEQLRDNLMRLPLSPADDLSQLSPLGRSQMERAMVFLRTDLEYEPPRVSRLYQLALFCVAIFLLGALVEIIAQDRLIPAVARPVRIVTLIAGAGFIVPQFLLYLLFLFSALRQITLVRLMKRERSDDDPDDHWPFRDDSQMREHL